MTMASVPKPDPQEAAKYFQQKLDCTTGPIELSHWIEEKASVQVVDVRAADDFEKGHIPGAVNVPRDQWAGAKGLSRDKTNVIYCYSQTCHLAAAAAVEFSKKGFSCIELEGGFITWQRASLPVTQTAGKA